MRKPSKDILRLLEFINNIQGFVGVAMAQNNDQNQDRFKDVMGALEKAHDLCIEATSPFPPIEFIKQDEYETRRNKKKNKQSYDTNGNR